MSEISIQSLFNCKTNNNKTIDIKSITKKDDTFDIRKIILAKEEKRKKLCENYNKFYKQCINKIDIATSLGKSDLLYSVTKRIKDIPEYSSLDCLKYIEKRLSSLYMNTLIINNTTIFITWYYIEANIDNEKTKNASILSSTDNDIQK
jgi:hypothetical protein